MISFPAGTRIWIAAGVTDMRCGFQGLAAKRAPIFPDDVELLKALLVEARSLLAERDVEIEQFKAQIDKLRRMQFGRKSEQLLRQIETLETQLEDLAAGRGVADVQRAQARGANASTSNARSDEAASKQALPGHLPREDHVLEPGSSCPDCGQPMQVLGEDVSEQLARVAAAFKVVRTIRPKLFAHAAARSPSRQCPGCRSSGALPIRACWQTSSSRSMQTTSRFTGNRRSPRATA